MASIERTFAVSSFAPPNISFAIYSSITILLGKVGFKKYQVFLGAELLYIRLCLSVCLSVCVSVYLSVCMSFYANLFLFIAQLFTADIQQ